MCTNFQAKRTTLTFLAQIYPKMDLRSEIQKTSVGIRISIVNMPCVPVFREKGTTLTFSTQICSKMDFGVGISKIRIRNLHFQDTMCVNFQLKRTTSTFLAQICPNMDFRVGISKI